MHVHELKERFAKQKDYAAQNLNELLDFAKRAYIFNEITSREYKNLVRELEQLGATLPAEKHTDNLLIEN
jgi:two-component SAPR family response regulator